MLYQIKNKLSEINKIKLSSKKIFFVSIFILPTIPFFSSIFILIASIVHNRSKLLNYFKDKWNYPFLIITFFLLFSFFYNVITNFNNSNYGGDPILNFLGLLNFVPFFFLFWSIENFIKTPLDRKRLILFAISGTIPVAISGLCQIWLGWSGPFEIFNGLIIWYQNDMQGLSGPFNNANYASLWLAIIFQFCISDLINLRVKDKFKKLILFIASVLILTALILTKSRSGLLSISYSTPLLFTNNFIFPIILLTTPVFILILFLIFKFLIIDYISFLGMIIPSNIERFEISNFFNIESFPRIFIWDKSIELIRNNPINGYGAGSLPNLLKINGNERWFGHAHNLPLDIAVNYGLPSALFISLTVYFILYFSCKKLYQTTSLNKKEIFYDRGWYSATIVFIFSHFVDIQYFDFRLSMLGWILLCGLKNIINTKYIQKRE